MINFNKIGIVNNWLRDLEDFSWQYCLYSQSCYGNHWRQQWSIVGTDAPDLVFENIVSSLSFAWPNFFSRLDSLCMFALHPSCPSRVTYRWHAQKVFLRFSTLLLTCLVECVTCYRRWYYNYGLKVSLIIGFGQARKDGFY